MIDHITDPILTHAAGATRTPAEGLAVLNVLCKGRAPSVLAAVLSRDFGEFDPSLAIKHGHALALLPYYPSYILFDDLWKTLGAAGALGDLPTIQLLWQLVGPATIGRLSWCEEYGFFSQAINDGHAMVLHWLERAASSASISIDWMSQSWVSATLAGHTGVVNWAIAHGYFEELSCLEAVISTRNGSISVVEWWIASQPNQEAVMTALGDANMLVELTREGAIGALDWWWAYTGSQLPNLTMFAKIADAAVVSSSLLVVEWWWTRFLEHRTPEHKFGMPRMAKELCFFNHVGILDWYGQRYKESRDQELSYFPRPLSGDSNELGVDFVLKSPPSLPIMQWAVEKCAEMDGQKLTLMPGFTSACASNGRVDLLDYALSSAEYLVMDWHDDLVAQAVESGQIEMLEWWDRNRGALPPQDLNCSSYLSRATLSDAVDVLAWWHAHRFPASKADWQQVCIEAIKNDASYVQLWLLDRLDLFAPDTNEELIVFTNACMSVLLWAKPFTYDFVRTAFPDLDMSVWIPVADHAYSCLTTLYFWCGFCNITVTSLLPLKPTILDTLLKARSVAMIEWWLQLHLAAGHPFVLPTARKLNEIYRRCKISHQWVYDVTVVRKLPVFVESEVGVVPYTSPPPPFPPPF